MLNNLKTQEVPMRKTRDLCNIPALMAHTHVCFGSSVDANTNTTSPVGIRKCNNSARIIKLRWHSSKITFSDTLSPFPDKSGIWGLLSHSCVWHYSDVQLVIEYENVYLLVSKPKICLDRKITERRRKKERKKKAKKKLKKKKKERKKIRAPCHILETISTEGRKARKNIYMI